MGNQQSTCSTLFLLFLLLLFSQTQQALKSAALSLIAPEGLLIPISDTGLQSLIIYSCPAVNNETKQNKKMIEIVERWGVRKLRTKSFIASEILLPRSHCWTLYHGSDQNHNCLHCCHHLILTPQVFNLWIDLFQLHFNKDDRKLEPFSLNF